MNVDSQRQYAEVFHDLHKKRDPLILFNAWDVAAARAIARFSPAIAMSSGATATALRYADGEYRPLDMLTGLVSRMTAAVSVSRAVAAGATPISEVTLPAFGGRVGRVRDLFGNIWWLQAHVEDVSEGEPAQRWKEPKWAKAIAYLQTSLTGGLEH